MYSILGMWQTFGAKVFADSRGKSLQTLEVITIQNFVLKVRLVFKVKVFSDFGGDNSTNSYTFLRVRI